MDYQSIYSKSCARDAKIIDERNFIQRDFIVPNVGKIVN